MRGRKPKPPHLRRRQNLPPPPSPPPSPEARLRNEDCPEFLGDVARAEWARVVVIEESLTVNDRAAVAAYCVAWERWSAAEQQVQKHGQLVKLKEGGQARTNPYISIAHQEHDRMVRLAAELRLTVVSRLRMPIARRRPADVLDAPLMETDGANDYALRLLDGGKP